MFKRGWGGEGVFFLFRFIYKFVKFFGSFLLFMYFFWGLKRLLDCIGNFLLFLNMVFILLGFLKKIIVFFIIVFLNIGLYFVKVFWRVVICLLNLIVWVIKLNVLLLKYGNFYGLGILLKDWIFFGRFVLFFRRYLNKFCSVLKGFSN